MQVKWKLKLFSIMAILMSAVVLSISLKAEDITSDIRAHFQKESDYQSYLINNVKFNDITFKIEKIEKGDNFWKVAKRNSIKIDTLIGVNPHWRGLFASINQKVVIPSEMGVLEFIKDYDDIERIKELYGVDDSSISIEEKPLFYRYYYKFKADRKPIAVFVKSVKPRVANMTAKLAAKFEQREMFRSPLGGRLSSFFGSRRHPIFKKRRFHNGLDIAARRGTYVGASRSGRVISAGWNGGYGKAVVVQHDKGYRTLYGHLSTILVRRGQYVKAGRIVGRVGSTGWSTGPHLHFTIWKNNKLINPLNVLW